MSSLFALFLKEIIAWRTAVRDVRSDLTRTLRGA